jgi:acetylornithine deacetylase/succinyl-diaminopimelate desuccinylase-like protein
MTTQPRRAGLVLMLVVAGGAASSAQDFRAAVERYVTANQRAIVSELVDLVAIPNTPADTENIRRNAQLLRDMLRRRSFTTEILETDSNPLVWGELRAPGAKRTLLIWAHYDGQPVDLRAWRQPSPYTAVLRSGRLEEGAKEVSGIRSLTKFDPNWRLYGRSAADDKAPIVALLAAIDALKAAGVMPSSNVRVVLDAEVGSTSLTATFPRFRDKLTADVMVLLEGPAHPSGRPTIAFGVRGLLAMDLTVYGPKVGVSSGNYGNWVPNPALRLAWLLTSMKGDDGRVFIDDFYNGVAPVTAEEQAMLDAVPDEPASLMKALGIAAPERKDLSLQQALQLPALNIRGLASGVIGGDATVVIPDRATAFLEVRLVKETPAKVMAERILAHIRAQGYHVVSSEPDDETRGRYPHLVKVVVRGGAGDAWRTPPLAPEAQLLTAAVTRTFGEAPVLIRTMGQRMSTAQFIEAMGAPAIVLPTVNFDNNQAAENENLRLGHLFTGILTIAAVLTM